MTPNPPERNRPEATTQIAAILVVAEQIAAVAEQLRRIADAIEALAAQAKKDNAQ